MTTVTEPVASVGTVTMTARDLNILLGGAAPFAEEGDFGTPTLQCVRIEAAGGIICASATDKYHLGHIRRPADGILAPVYIRRDGIEEVIERLDARATFVGSRDEMVKLSVDTNLLRIEFGDHVMDIGTEDVIVWPDLGKLIAKSPTGSHDTEGPVGIGTNSLRVLTEALEGGDRPHAVTRWSVGGPKSPIVVEVGDWFVAMFMPCVAKSGEVPLNALARVPYGLPNS